MYQVPADPALAAQLQANDPAAVRAAPGAVKLTLADFYQLPVAEGLKFIDRMGENYAGKQSRSGASVLGHRGVELAALAAIRARSSSSSGSGPKSKSGARLACPDAVALRGRGGVDASHRRRARPRSRRVRRRP